jgi:hypothetical protein
MAIPALAGAPVTGSVRRITELTMTEIRER